MKIAISSKGKDLNATVEPRFGRASYFIIIETDTLEYKLLENSGFNSAHGAGVLTGQMISKEDVAAVITGNVGPNAFQTLIASEIKMYHASDIPIAEAIDAFKKDQLELIQESGPPHGGGAQ